MGLTNRERKGVRRSRGQPGRVGPPPLRIPLRKKVEITVVSVAVLASIAVVVNIFRNVREEQRNRPVAVKDTSNRFDANADSGRITGSAMGHLTGTMGRAYPSDPQIEQMARTSAVDAGSTVNDSIFIGSFKRAFAKGYAEGRRSR